VCDLETSRIGAPYIYIYIYIYIYDISHLRVNCGHMLLKFLISFQFFKGKSFGLFFRNKRLTRFSVPCCTLWFSVHGVLTLWKKKLQRFFVEMLSVPTLKITYRHNALAKKTALPGRNRTIDRIYHTLQWEEHVFYFPVFLQGWDRPKKNIPISNNYQLATRVSPEAILSRFIFLSETNFKLYWSRDVQVILNIFRKKRSLRNFN